MCICNLWFRHRLSQSASCNRVAPGCRSIALCGPLWDKGSWYRRGFGMIKQGSSVHVHISADTHPFNLDQNNKWKQFMARRTCLFMVFSYTFPQISVLLFPSPLMPSMCCFSVWLMLSAQSVENYPMLLLGGLKQRTNVVHRFLYISCIPIVHYLSPRFQGLLQSLPLMFFPCGLDFLDKVSTKTRKSFKKRIEVTEIQTGSLQIQF